MTTKTNGRSIWAQDAATGKRRNLTYEEDEAFWAFAAIEVLRLTGVRGEELLELTHHSITEYRLPSTGELVPLLQIAPSKTDTERLLLDRGVQGDGLGSGLCHGLCSCPAMVRSRSTSRRKSVGRPALSWGSAS
jgi:hypothetical protein